VNFKKFFTERYISSNGVADRYYKLPSSKLPHYILKDELTQYKFSNDEENSIGLLKPYRRVGNVHAACTFEPNQKDLRIFLFHLAKYRHTDEKPRNAFHQRLWKDFYESVVDNTVNIINEQLKFNPDAVLYYVQSKSPFNDAVRSKIDIPSHKVSKKTFGDLYNIYKSNKFILNSLVKSNIKDDKFPNRSIIAKDALEKLLNIVGSNPDIQQEPLSLEKAAEYIIDLKIIDKDKIPAGDVGFATNKAWVQERLVPNGFFNLPEATGKIIIVIDDNINSESTYNEINSRISQRDKYTKIIWVVGIMPEEVIKDIK